MNIKPLAPNPVLSVEPKQKVDNVRTHSSTERDADGRRQQAEQEIKRHLNDEEFQEAIKALEEHPGLKSNNLTVTVERKDDCRTILVLDPSGTVVRRLSESQLWAATRDKDRHTGKILDKAM